VNIAASYVNVAAINLSRRTSRIARNERKNIEEGPVLFCSSTLSVAVERVLWFRLSRNLLCGVLDAEYLLSSPVVQLPSG